MKTAALGIDGCGDQRLWRREDGEDSGGWNHRGVAATGISGGRRPQRRWLKVKMVSVAAKCWSMGFGGWWVDVADGSRWVSLFFFFFFGFVGAGSVIRGGHGWRSLAWVASLASLLAWG